VGASVDLEFPTGVALGGIVLVDGEPAANFAVRIQNPGSLPSGSTTTDGGGRFRLEGVAAGPVVLQATDPQTQVGAEVLVEVGDVDQLDLELVVVSATLVGRVVDTAGQPVAGATATVYREDAAIRLEGNGDGRLEARKLAPGRAWLLVAADGYAGRRHDLELVAGVTTEVEVTLEAAADLSLGVRGVVPSMVTVALRSAGTTVHVEHVEVSSDGLARVRSAPAGSFEVHVAGEGPTTTLTLQLPSPDVHTVVLRPTRSVSVEIENSGAPLELLVRDGAGKLASFISWRGEVRERLTVAYGRMPLALPEGVWTLEASASDGRRWSGSVPATGSAAVTLEVAAAP
jgi:hypothetical protein